jgi:hypothetical protein
MFLAIFVIVAKGELLSGVVGTNIWEKNDFEE